jgi:hypothetical protein
MNEGECEAQVITPDLIGGFKCGLPAGHQGEHERRLPGHELNPNTLKETEIVVRWKVAHESTKR